VDSYSDRQAPPFSYFWYTDQETILNQTAGNFEIVKMLLEAGADPNAESNVLHTRDISTLSSPFVRTKRKYLLFNGKIYSNMTNSSENALHMALMHGPNMTGVRSDKLDQTAKIYESIVLQLLQYGANVNSLDQQVRYFSLVLSWKSTNRTYVHNAY
jgi:hypothetical protein